jgi:hypothetical protein
MAAIIEPPDRACGDADLRRGAQMSVSRLKVAIAGAAALLAVTGASRAQVVLSAPTINGYIGTAGSPEFLINGVGDVVIPAGETGTGFVYATLGGPIPGGIPTFAPINSPGIGLSYSALSNYCVSGESCSGGIGGQVFEQYQIEDYVPGAPYNAQADVTIKIGDDVSNVGPGGIKVTAYVVAYQGATPLYSGGQYSGGQCVGGAGWNFCGPGTTSSGAPLVTTTFQMTENTPFFVELTVSGGGGDNPGDPPTVVGGLSTASADIDPYFTTNTGTLYFSPGVLNNPVPEPASWAIVFLGAAAVGGAMRRARRDRAVATA